MLSRLRSKVSALFVAAIFAVGSFLMVPAQPQAEASECGSGSAQKCAHSEVCVDLIILESCSETWKYWTTSEE